jgi:hypothetical protein
MADLTINEALGWMTTLKERHAELVNLRNQNSRDKLRYIGANAEKTIEEKALYDPKALDKTITTLAREIRLLDMAIKRTNATTKVAGYNQDEAVLGELA